MPIMIRANDKIKKIVDKVMGKAKADKTSQKKKESDKKLDFEESRKI